MAEYRKFYLVSRQQSPSEGSTGIAMPSDGGIVWIGDKWIAKDITNHIMSQEEIDEYNLVLKYMSDTTEWFITFEDYKDETKLAAIKTNIKTEIDNLTASISVEK